MKNRKSNLYRDFMIMVLSIVAAVFLAKSGFIEVILNTAQSVKLFGAFLAGVFFISIFSAAPAAVVLANLFQTNNIIEITVMAAIGSMIGDLVVFRFVKDNLSQDLNFLLETTGFRRIKKMFNLKLFHWFVPFLGAIIIASPFPDELGISLLGISKMKIKFFIPLSFALNFFGIIIIGLIVKNFI